VTTDQVQTRRRSAAPSSRHALSKVPEVTVYFWIAKILTTGMGETTSDFFTKKYNPVLAVIGGFLVFAVTIAVQFRAKRYSAWIYWIACAMVSVFGTMAADVLHVQFGIPYVVSTAFFTVCLIAVFILWYKLEGTLSIHSIHTPRRELFYWLTVVTTFALGTATGDMTATTLHLGYFSSGVMFAVIFAIPALAHRFAGLNAIFAFWFAYIVTRPFGASFADWIGVNKSRGGLDWGTGKISMLLAALIVIVVGYLAYSKVDVDPED
jgi:uncharacterized membrane-anchored protein